ncbi:MAG: hypothetical protein FJ358_05600 [Thaumarchaeota archaeon]|nr:hypothetical protein [Nitrososphaerota archaeon]
MKSRVHSSRFLIAITVSLAGFLLLNSPYPFALGQWASIDIESAPSTLMPGEKVKITWEVEGEGKISHTAVHWDTRPGTPGNFRSYGRTTPEFASINPPDDAPREYRVSFDAPASGTIHYIVHAVVDGKDYYNLWERTVPIEGVSGDEAELQSLTLPASVDFYVILGLAAGVALIALFLVAIKRTRNS